MYRIVSTCMCCVDFDCLSKQTSSKKKESGSEYSVPRQAMNKSGFHQSLMRRHTALKCKVQIASGQAE